MTIINTFHVNINLFFLQKYVFSKIKILSNKSGIIIQFCKSF